MFFWKINFVKNIFKFKKTKIKKKIRIKSQLISFGYLVIKLFFFFKISYKMYNFIRLFCIYVLLFPNLKTTQVYVNILINFKRFSQISTRVQLIKKKNLKIKCLKKNKKYWKYLYQFIFDKLRFILKKKIIFIGNIHNKRLYTFLNLYFQYSKCLNFDFFFIKTSYRFIFKKIKHIKKNLKKRLIANNSI